MDEIEDSVRLWRTREAQKQAGRWSLDCLICDRWHGLTDLVQMQEHVMYYHGYSQRDLQLNSKRAIEGGFIFTMPDGRDWMRAVRVSGKVATCSG